MDPGTPFLPEPKENREGGAKDPKAARLAKSGCLVRFWHHPSEKSELFEFFGHPSEKSELDSVRV